MASESCVVEGSVFGDLDRVGSAEHGRRTDGAFSTGSFVFVGGFIRRSFSLTVSTQDGAESWGHLRISIVGLMLAIP